jgi:hypothetical protein
VNVNDLKSHAPTLFGCVILNPPPVGIVEFTGSCLLLVLLQSQSAKKAILTALADEEMMKILDSVMYHSKSIVDISREKDIPHTTCYRKTKWLLKATM